MDSYIYTACVNVDMCAPGAARGVRQAAEARAGPGGAEPPAEGHVPPPPQVLLRLPAPGTSTILFFNESPHSDTST